MQLKTLSVILAGFIICFYIMALQPGRPQQNTPPKVAILKPALKDRFKWNSIVRYNISVSDKEDGVSEYNEIIPREVILKTVYLPDSTKARDYISKELNSGPEAKGLTLIKTSTCFNCHTVKNKLIGPSFQDVAKRYSRRTDSVKLLETKVIKGSKNVWDIVEMPPNPEIKIEDAHEIVQWIMKNCGNPNIDYLPGLEGAFRIIPKPLKNAGKGVYILTASYTDHGVPQTPQQHKEGKHVIMLKSN